MAKKPVDEVRLRCARDPRGNCEEIHVYVEDDCHNLTYSGRITVSPFTTDLDVLGDVLRMFGRNGLRIV